MNFECTVSADAALVLADTICPATQKDIDVQHTLAHTLTHSSAHTHSHSRSRTCVRTYYPHVLSHAVTAHYAQTFHNDRYVNFECTAPADAALVLADTICLKKDIDKHTRTRTLAQTLTLTFVRSYCPHLLPILTADVASSINRRSTTTGT